MDTVKIGKFLAALRHEKALTQEQLGERLGVTNKTVSRWETGSYLPPVEMLQALSGFYEVSINEILSGQRLSAQEYRREAEENIKAALAESAFGARERADFFRKKWKKEHALSLTLEMLAILAAIFAGCWLGNGLQAVAVIGGLVWCAAKRNQMAAYVEQRVFGGARTPEGEE